MGQAYTLCVCHDSESQEGMTPDLVQLSLVPSYLPMT